MEVICLFVYSECPLSEVPLYVYTYTCIYYVDRVLKETGNALENKTGRKSRK